MTKYANWSTFCVILLNIGTNIYIYIYRKKSILKYIISRLKADDLYLFSMKRTFLPFLFEKLIRNRQKSGLKRRFREWRYILTFEKQKAISEKERFKMDLQKRVAIKGLVHLVNHIQHKQKEKIFDLIKDLYNQAKIRERYTKYLLKRLIIREYTCLKRCLQVWKTASSRFILFEKKIQGVVKVSVKYMQRRFMEKIYQEYLFNLRIKCYSTVLEEKILPMFNRNNLLRYLQHWKADVNVQHRYEQGFNNTRKIITKIYLRKWEYKKDQIHHAHCTFSMKLLSIRVIMAKYDVFNIYYIHIYIYIYYLI